MAGAKRLKRQIIITSNGLDFPCGFAPNAQGKELGQALIDMEFDPLLIPQKLSSFPEEPSRGTYFRIPYDYLRNTRKSAGSKSNALLRKIAGALYSVAASFRLAAYLLHNRKTVAGVFDLSNQTLPLIIEGIACRMLGIPLVYFVWEEVCSHRINRQSSIGLKWIHRAITLVEAPLLYGIALRLPKGLTYLTDTAYRFLKKWGYGDRALFDFPVVKYRDPNVQETADSGIVKPGMDLVFTGTINTEKDDFISVIRAIAALKEEYPQIRLKIYGSAEGTAAHDIEEIAMGCGVADRIEFMGWFKLEDLDIVRREALALLVLKRDISFNRYNFPSRILDFIDSGRPLIISDLPAHAKYFSDRENAFVIPEGDVERLVSAIRTAIEEPLFVEKMTRKAACLLDQRFDAAKNLQSMLAALRIVESPANQRLV